MVGVACSAPSASGDGTAASPSTAPIPDAATLTAYDPAAPLDLDEESPVQTLDGGIEIHDVSWASLGTDRVSAWLVVPPGGGPFAGLVYLHGSETDRDDFLDEAVAMARGGAASIVMDAPFARTGTSRKAFLLNFGLAERERDMTAQTVLDLRRAYDVLLERGDVDPEPSGLRRPFLGRLAGSGPCRGRRASRFAGDHHRPTVVDRVPGGRVRGLGPIGSRARQRRGLAAVPGPHGAARRDGRGR